MTKSDLIKIVGQSLSNRSEASKAVELVLTTIQNSLRAGEKVVLSNFGTFRVKARQGRQARNPKTGASVAVPPRRGVRFKASKNFLQ